MKKIEKLPWDEVEKKGMQLHGFTIVQNELKTKIARDTSPQAAFLYITLLSHKNSKTKKTFPSIDVLSRELGVSPRTISNLLSDLYDAGYIEINSGKTKVANNYFFPYEEDYDEQMVDRFGYPYRRKTAKFKKKQEDDNYWAYESEENDSYVDPF